MFSPRQAGSERAEAGRGEPALASCCAGRGGAARLPAAVAARGSGGRCHRGGLSGPAGDGPRRGVAGLPPVAGPWAALPFAQRTDVVDANQEFAIAGQSR